MRTHFGLGTPRRAWSAHQMLTFLGMHGGLCVTITLCMAHARHVARLTPSTAAAHPHRANGGGATSSDLLEVERASRQLAELGVVDEVHASLLHHRQLHLSAQGSVAHTASSAEVGAHGAHASTKGRCLSQKQVFRGSGRRHSRADCMLHVANQLSDLQSSSTGTDNMCVHLLLVYRLTWMIGRILPCLGQALQPHQHHTTPHTTLPQATAAQKSQRFCFSEHGLHTCGHAQLVLGLLPTWHPSVQSTGHTSSYSHCHAHIRLHPALESSQRRQQRRLAQHMQGWLQTQQAVCQKSCVSCLMRCWRSQGLG